MIDDRIGWARRAAKLRERLIEARREVEATAVGSHVDKLRARIRATDLAHQLALVERNYWWTVAGKVGSPAHVEDNEVIRD